MTNEDTGSGQEAGEGLGWQHRSKEFTDGIHVSGQPGITIGITVGHEAQGYTDQPGTKQASDKPAGDSKLGGVKKQRKTRGCTCWVSRSVEQALGGGKKKIQGMTGSYTNATICLPRYPGAPSKGLGWRTCWARLRGLERHGCPGLLLWSPLSRGQGHTAATMLPYSCLGKGVEPRRKWVPWNSLGEGSMGRRKEREHGEMVCLLSRCNQCSFPSMTSELPTAVI